MLLNELFCKNTIQRTNQASVHSILNEVKYTILLPERTKHNKESLVLSFFCWLGGRSGIMVIIEKEEKRSKVFYLETEFIHMKS